MSGFCPEGQGDCPDAKYGPCVVGYPCALYPAKDKTEEGDDEQ